MEILKWIKKNKVLFAVLIFLVVANLYVAGVVLSEKQESQNINGTPDGQTNIITDSPGSSVNGDVVNNNPTRTQVVTKQGQTKVVTVEKEEEYLGTTVKPDHGDT